MPTTKSVFKQETFLSDESDNVNLNLYYLIFNFI